MEVERDEICHRDQGDDAEKGYQPDGPPADQDEEYDEEGQQGNREEQPVAPW